VVEVVEVLVVEEWGYEALTRLLLTECLISIRAITSNIIHHQCRRNKWACREEGGGEEVLEEEEEEACSLFQGLAFAQMQDTEEQARVLQATHPLEDQAGRAL